MSQNVSRIDADELLHPASVTRSALPVMAGLLLEQVVGLTDVLFLGRYGEAELAAAGIASIFVMLLMMLGLGYATGAQALMSRANGAGSAELLGRTFRQAALFLTAAGAAVAVATLFLYEPLLGRTIRSAEVHQASWDYVFWRTLALPVAYLGCLCRSFFVSILRPGILTVSSIVMVAVNCSLNAFLIFGNGPFPELGIAGAAIASMLAELAALGVLGGRLLLDRRLSDSCLARTADRWRIDRSLQRELFGLGRWLMLQEAVAFGVWLYFFVCVEHAAGERGLAVSNVLRQLGALLFLGVHAYGTATGALAANLAGAGEERRIGEAVRVGLLSCLMLMTPVGAVFLCFPEAVTGLITDIPDVVQSSRTAYWIMTVSYLASVPAYLLFFVLVSLGLARETFRVTMLSALVYALYVGGLSQTTTSVPLFWTSDAVYSLGLGLGSWFVWRRCRKDAAGMG